MAQEFNWKPWAWGVGVTLALALAAIGAFYRRAPAPGQLDNPYAAQVAIGDSRVSRADSMMGGSVVYWEGTLDNRGAQTLTGYTVDLTFVDPYGKVVQRERRVLLDNRFRPLPPHTSRDFQIGFDTVDPGWNQAPPQAAPAAVYTH